MTVNRFENKDISSLLQFYVILTEFKAYEIIKKAIIYNNGRISIPFLNAIIGEMRKRKEDFRPYHPDLDITYNSLNFYEEGLDLGDLEKNLYAYLKFLIIQNNINRLYLIDTNNQCYTNEGNVSFEKLIKLYDKFKQKCMNHVSHDFYFICDGSIFKKIDDRKNFKKFLFSSNKIIVVDGGIEADNIILSIYDKFNSQINVKIISNDKFRDHEEFSRIISSDLISMNLNNL